MQRNKLILIKVNEEEKNGFKTEAQKLGISVAAFIRLLYKQWTNGITFEKSKSNENRN